MRLEGEQVLLRVSLRNTDKYGWWQPAADALVERARHGGLAGATALRGIFGLDVTGRLLERGTWSLAEHDPVIVEIVDGSAAIGPVLDTVGAIVSGGPATLERGHVLRYGAEAVASGGERLAVPGPVTPLSTLPSPEECPAMKLSEDGQLLRVFIGESDEWHGTPLYRAIVL